jgi:hypothetical protein
MLRFYEQRAVLAIPRIGSPGGASSERGSHGSGEPGVADCACRTRSRRLLHGVRPVVALPSRVCDRVVVDARPGHGSVHLMHDERRAQGTRGRGLALPMRVHGQASRPVIDPLARHRAIALSTPRCSRVGCRLRIGCERPQTLGAQLGCSPAIRCVVVTQSCVEPRC